MVNVNKLEQAINDLDSSKNSILKIKDIVENITELQNSQNKET